MPIKQSDTKTVKPAKKSTTASPAAKAAAPKKEAAPKAVKAGAPKASAKKAASAVKSVENVSELVRVRAYEIYQQRGGHHGLDQNDWLQAEAEILKGL